MTKKKIWSRRDFFKTVGSLGIGTMAASISNADAAEGKSGDKVSEANKMPTRPFGRTGIHVPVLSLGGSMNFLSRQLILKQAVKMGVTYWDTAYIYSGGKSEEGIGKYFKKFPEDRKKIFLVTKAPVASVSEISANLQTSLSRMNTSYVDLFFIHSISDVKEDMTADIKKWAEKAKSKGLIKLFGFSVHKNMEKCLLDGAKLGWVDGIMTTYNYRLMNEDPMKKAVDACSKAGIGLTAMKTQASFKGGLYASVGKKNSTGTKLVERFSEKGFTPEQAKLKVVWENPQIASICSHMKNMTMLKANVAAALDRRSLSRIDINLFEQYAGETASDYCAGCTDICEKAIHHQIPVGDIMRYLMYSKVYSEHDVARKLFHKLPAETVYQMGKINYLKAEQKCPRNIPITSLMKRALNELV